MKSIELRLKRATKNRLNLKNNRSSDLRDKNYRLQRNARFQRKRKSKSKSKFSSGGQDYLRSMRQRRERKRIAREVINLTNLTEIPGERPNFFGEELELDL